MTDPDRAERACRDVLAVELFAPGMARVVTLGGCYTVDARGEGCQCPDKEYHLEPGEQCKHHAAAFLATSDDHPTPFLVREDLSDRQDPEFELERPPRIGRNHTFGAYTDGGREYVDELRIYGTRSDGRPRVERRRAKHTDTATQAQYDTLPPECAAFVEGTSTPVSDLPADVQAWIDAHSREALITDDDHAETAHA